MKIREWIANNIGYRFFGCFYNKTTGHVFDFIETKVPKDFLGKNISDLGCGDGSNTIRIKKIFKVKSIVGYDHNDYLIKKARDNGLRVEKIDFNGEIPKGEMATLTFSLHHAKDKEKTLKKVVDNFDYIFLCEPILDLYHVLLDAGNPLKKKDWVNLFDKVLKKYVLYQYKNNLIVFYRHDSD